MSAEAKTVLVEIESLKTTVGARTDTELANLLGVQRSAIAQWKKRGRVPDKAKRQAQDYFRFREERDDIRRAQERLSPGLRQACRALALFHTFKSNNSDDIDDPTRMLIMASMFEGVERAAYLALKDEMASNSSDAKAAYGKLLSDPYGRDRLNSKLIEAKLIPLLTEAFPSDWS